METHFSSHKTIFLRLGHFVHPNWEGLDTSTNKLIPSQQVPRAEISEIKIEGCNYQLTEEEINLECS